MTQAPAFNLETVAGIELLLAERLEQIGGCGDGDCKVHRRGGQHTNGGCRCLRHDDMKAERVVGAYRAFRAAIMALHDADLARQMADAEAALWREHDARRATELSRLRADLAEAVRVLEPFARGYEESVRAYPLVGGETSQKTRYAKSNRAEHMRSSIGTYHFQQAAALLTRPKDAKP